jgi:NAD-reducing hydrogenase large subunit
MKRNIVGIVQEYPDIAKRGISLHQYGQEVIRATSGKRIHPMTAVAGGFTKHLSKEERDALYKNADSAIGWTVEALELCRKVSKLDDARMSQFGTVESNYMSICQPDGSLDLYDGLLRVIDAQGKKIFDQIKAWEYQDYLAEETRSWSYMKFPYIRSLGWENGWYRVGPLAQLNCCDFMDTPIAENERQVFKFRGNGKPVHSTLAYHEARAIISIHAAEKIKAILEDDQVLSGELMAKPGIRRKEGVAFLEAPRGTLFHHYEVDEYDKIQRANLIVSTTNNNEAMNRSVARVAFDELSGRNITEPLLNKIEVAVRAYDPCLSCATHAVGQMPLEVLLEGPEGELLGGCCR